MTQFRIRPATAADLPVLSDLFRRSSLSNPGDVAALMAHPEVLTFSDRGISQGRTRVATSTSDHIVGFATTLRAGPVLELDDLFVDPEWMRRGVGRRLVQDALVVAARADIQRIDVTANPEALTFYESVGFTFDSTVETRFGVGLRMQPRYRGRAR
jgi:GNAT superfamily N-acetyltransferase